MASTIEIQQFPFNKKTPDQLEGENLFHEIKWADNWPVIYIINNDSEAYVGETYKVKERVKQHLQNQERLKLTRVNIILDEQSNKSYTLDIEASLIRYMSADNKFKLQNGNNGLVNYNYYHKENYKEKFEHEIWPKLKSLNLVKRGLKEIENDDLFKYSPYTQLGINQSDVVNAVIQNLSESKEGSIIINGSAGTGKTLIGSYLMKLLYSKERTYKDDETKDYLGDVQSSINKIGFVVPQQSLRKTFKRVFRKIHGLKPWMVVSPNDVAKESEKYDLLIVDEAHRLRQRRNLSNYQHYDENNRKLGLRKDATELDWIMEKSKYQVFFYDAVQTIKPTDILNEQFREKVDRKKISEYALHSQFRVLGEEDYITYIKNLLNCTLEGKKTFGEYEFEIFNNVANLKKAIKEKNNEHNLCRMVAGYGWKWTTKGKKEGFDIKIENEKMIWNTTGTDWVNSKNSVNEVGCIHTIQGYDLNYAGIIIGPEVTYSEEENKIKIIKENYYDTNGKRGVSDNKVLERYIRNIYGVLLTRGIKGTYVYVVDEKLRKYMKKYIPVHHNS